MDKSRNREWLVLRIFQLQKGKFEWVTGAVVRFLAPAFLQSPLGPVAGSEISLAPNFPSPRLNWTKSGRAWYLVLGMTTSFEELADSYECIFFDAFGVLKSSAGLYEGVLERLRILRERGKMIFLVTNDASKSPHRMVAQYTHPDAGPMFSLERIISSGSLAADYLQNKVRNGYVAYLGKDAASYYIASAGLHPVPIGAINADEHSPKALVLLDDEGFDWFGDLNRAVNLVRRHNMPVVIANSDITYPVNARDVGIAVGGIGALMEQAVGQQFIRFGKPDPMIFSKAFHLALEERPQLTKRDVLMVGDTLFTDIRGGNKYGIDTALVLSGTTLEKDYRSLIQATGIVPNYVCESILT